MEGRASRARVAADVEETGVEVEVGARLQALADAPAVLLAQSLAAQLGGGGDVDDVVAERTVDVLLYRQAVSLEGARNTNTTQ